MKITLIEPKNMSVHVFSKVKLPRLGLPIMATMLNQRGHDVQVQAEVVKSLDFQRILDSDIVGISTITATAPRAYELAKKIKSKKDIPIVIGGSHVTFFPEESLHYADYCVKGEGESTFLALLEALAEDPKKIKEIPGLAYVENGQVIQTSPLQKQIKVDDLPFPDLKLINGSENMNIVPIETSRGCPFGCKFCSVIKMFGRKYRFKSVDKIADELARISPAKVFFYDDNFAANRNRAYELMKKMRDRPDINVQWGAQVRADIYKDPELLQLMKQAGGKMLHIGFESINQETLDAYNKEFNISDMETAIKAIKDFGFHIHGMFVIGSDFDDKTTPKKTVDFAIKNRLDTIQLLILVPIPGSEQYQELKANDKLLPVSWEYYDGHHVVHKPERVSPYELQYEVMKEMSRFYSWNKCIKLLAKLNFVKFYFRIYGRRTIKRWFQQSQNQSYLKYLQSI